MLQRCMILSFVVTLVVALHDDTGDNVDYKNVVKSFVEKRCSTNGGPKAFDNLMKGGQEFSSCAMLTIFSNTANTEEFLSLICSEFQPKLHSCFVLLLDAIEPCLDKEEKYLTNFASGWFNSSFEDHCKDGRAVFLDHEHEWADLKCEGTNMTDERALEECFSASSVIKDLQEPDFVVRKDSLCAYLEHGNKCFLDILQEYCKERVYKFVEFHLRPTKVWCTKYVNQMDN